MVDGYDYDFMVADWDNDTLTIVRGGWEREYTLSIEKSLWEGGKANGVEHQEIGHPEDAEDYDEDKNTDEGDEDAVMHGKVTYQDGHTYTYNYYSDRGYDEDW